MLVPVCLQVFREGRTLPSAQWAVFSTVLGLLAVLASISAGRVAFGPGQSKSSRYAEFGMALIPNSALGWGFLLRDRKRVKAVCLACLWVLCSVTFWDNWRFDDYMYYQGNRMLGVRCVRQYYLTGGDALCPRLYPGSLAARLDAARELKASLLSRSGTAPSGRKEVNTDDLDATGGEVSGANLASWPASP